MCYYSKVASLVIWSLDFSCVPDGDTDFVQRWWLRMSGIGPVYGIISNVLSFGLNNFCVVGLVSFQFIGVLSSAVDCVFVLLLMCMSLEWYLSVV